MTLNEVKEMNDEHLYKDFLLGNKNSFNQLIIKYRIHLTNFIMYYVKNYDIAEDIAQDSFLYMIINKKDYNFKYSFKTYLYTIAKSRALNYLKKAKRTIYIEESVFNESISEINLEDEVIKTYDNTQLIKAIKQLKTEYQIIIWLYYFQNFKYKEISSILSISMSKTKMSISRAKKHIKKYLKEDEEND